MSFVSVLSDETCLFMQAEGDVCSDSLSRGNGGLSSQGLLKGEMGGHLGATRHGSGRCPPAASCDIVLGLQQEDSSLCPVMDRYVERYCLRPMRVCLFEPGVEKEIRQTSLFSKTVKVGQCMVTETRSSEQVQKDIPQTESTKCRLALKFVLKNRLC